MRSRGLGIIAVGALSAVGCATGTAHRLQVTGSPVADAAAACERACRVRLSPEPPQCTATIGDSDTCSSPRADRADYVRCLDACPGATAIDGESCPDPPAAGVLCEQTYKANAGAIAGGTAAAVALALALAVIAGMASVFGALDHPFR